MHVALFILVLAHLAFFLIKWRSDMASQQEVLNQLNAVITSLDKVATETGGLKTKIQELEDAIANGGGSSPEVDAALAALKSKVDAIDGLVEDAPTEPPQQ